VGEVVVELQEEARLRSTASRSTGSSSGSPEPASATSISLGERLTERQLRHFDRALQQEELAKRADLVEDLAVAMWGGKGVEHHVQALRKKR
jgi:hypothetical protein